MEALTASALLGLKRDLHAAARGQCCCPVITSLVVQSLFGGSIFRYDHGLQGSDYVNELRTGDSFVRIDLTRDFMQYDSPGFATEEVSSYDLLRNDDTHERFRQIVANLLERWQGEFDDPARAARACP